MNAPTLGLCRNIDMAIRERCTTVTVMQEFSAKRAVGIRWVMPTWVGQFV